MKAISRVLRDAVHVGLDDHAEGAADLVSALLPKTTDEERVHGLERAVTYANSLGIVGLQEASADSDILVAYHTLDQRGALMRKRKTRPKFRPGLEKSGRDRFCADGRNQLQTSTRR